MRFSPIPTRTLLQAGHTVLRSLCLMLGSITIGILVGCQAATHDVLDVEPPQARQARRAVHGSKPQETFGAGPTRIGFITARMANAGESEQERDILDGALLAVDELGDGQLTLAIENTDGSSQQARDAAQRLTGQGVKLIAVSAAKVPLTVVREGVASRGLPILAFRNSAPDLPAGTFSFVSDRIDSAVEGASYAAASGRTRLIVLLSADLTASERQRLDAGLARDNIKPLLVSTPGAVSFSGDSPLKAKVKDVDSVLLLNAGDGDVGALAQLRANGFLKPNAIVLGSSDWPSAAYQRPELAGSQLCLFGPESGSRMTSSFRQRYERTANVYGAYGFDFIALVAGLVRTGGQEAINEQSIRSPNGFIGAAAAFRFEGGSVKRTCAIYQIARGSLHLVDPAPRSF